MNPPGVAVPQGPPVPPGGAPGVPVPPAAPGLPLGPTTYLLEKYLRDTDALQGNYQALLAPYAANSGNDHNVLMARLIMSSELVPKIFVARA